LVASRTARRVAAGTSSKGLGAHHHSVPSKRARRLTGKNRGVI
jgi:hypothetical protein